MIRSHWTARAKALAPPNDVRSSVVTLAKSIARYDLTSQAPPVPGAYGDRFRQK